MRPLTDRPRAHAVAAALAVVAWLMVMAAGVLLTDPSSDAAQHLATGRSLSRIGSFTGHVPQFLLPDGTEEPAWYPGHYHLLSAALFGTAGAPAVRLLGAFSFAASGLAAYLLLRRLGTPHLGLAAVAGLIAFRPAFPISIEPYVEPLLLPMAALGFLLLHRLVQAPRWATAVALALVVSALVATKQQGWFLAAGAGGALALLLAGAWRSRGARLGVVAVVGGILLAAPLVLIYVRSFLLTPLASEDYFGTYVNAAAADPIGTLSFFVGRLPPLWPLGALAAAVAVAGLARLMRKDPGRGVLLTATGASAALFLPIWFAALTESHRYWLPMYLTAFLAAAALAALAVRAATRARPRAAAWGALVAALLLLPAVATASAYPERFAGVEDRFPGPAGRFAAAMEAGAWVDRNLPPEAVLLGVRKNEIILYADRATIDYPRVEDFASPREFAAWLREHGVTHAWVDRTRAGTGIWDDEPVGTMIRWLYLPGAATLLHRNSFIDIVAVAPAVIASAPEGLLLMPMDARALQRHSWPLRLEPPDRFEPGPAGWGVQPGLPAYATVLLLGNDTARGALGLVVVDGVGSLKVAIRNASGGFGPPTWINGTATWAPRVEWIPLDDAGIRHEAGGRNPYAEFSMEMTGAMPIRSVAVLREASDAPARAWAAQASGLR